MKNKCFAGFVAVLFAAALLVTAPAAFAVSWTEWTSATIDPAYIGAGEGTLVIGSETINVSLTGMRDGLYDNTDWWQPSSTFAGVPNPSDMIREQGTGRVTLTFSKTIKDIYITLFSVGQPNNGNHNLDIAVSYAFIGLGPNSIEVISHGTVPNFYYANYSYFLSNNGNTITGVEFNGVLKLAGNFDSLTFDIGPNEYFHGFNIGGASVANTVPGVPEPATMLLLGLGLMGVAGMRKKFKK